MEEELTLEGALLKLSNCTTPPGANKGRTWYDVAQVLYQEIQRLQEHVPDEQRTFRKEQVLTEEERIAQYYEAQRPVQNYSICTVTSKRSYASPEAAIAASKKTGHKLRTYRCVWCRGHHVTKEPRL